MSAQTDPATSFLCFDKPPRTPGTHRPGVPLSHPELGFFTTPPAHPTPQPWDGPPRGGTDPPAEPCGTATSAARTQQVHVHGTRIRRIEWGASWGPGDQAPTQSDHWLASADAGWGASSRPTVARSRKERSTSQMGDQWRHRTHMTGTRRGLTRGPRHPTAAPPSDTPQWHPPVTPPTS